MRYLLLLILFFVINTAGFAQNCSVQNMATTKEFKYEPKFGQIEIDWYPEWLEHTNGVKKIPEPLKAQPKWDHPYMKYGYTAAMHEGPRSSDVSNRPGPTQNNPIVQYFHVKQKGGDFSGMCPTFAFINDSTMATLSFGRANTTLLLLDIKDTIRVLDHLPIPGRGSSAFELAGKKGRGKIFSNTAGGAYSYISNKNRIYIPGANNNILRVTVKDRKFIKDVESVNLKAQIEAGNLVEPHLSEKDKLNQLTALMPDVNGNIWFTSRQGVVGLIHREDKTKDGCPKVYSTFIGYFQIKEKIKEHYPESLSEIEKVLPYIHKDSINPEARRIARTALKIDKDTHEEIQNSFSVGKDGVYIVSNIALYKLRFNEETKDIELDPKWAESFKKGELVYDNNMENKPGHLNAGSGTTPTLMDDRFVAICDNDEGKINLCIFRQDDGELVSKLPLFGNNGSAVENSAVAYENTYIVANTFGYSDPFKVNATPGGIMRFDLSEESGNFEPVEGWPASGVYDCKTATPKLSTRTGMLYVYNRDEDTTTGHRDWQVTGIDFRTGVRVVYSKLFFEKGDFKDNINIFMKAGSLGNKHYDRKVFNNIWGTFTFGPNNSFYLGTYRGFIKVSSD
ncbi:hypothetical protein QWY87_07025 [Lutimonas halocynthiae]|uniref:hypothetical protein n=1 Tax=Lutimonas halocynthiae TaxID=1446477 RepID=UPI0025B4B686|nr:hypothetical protein [Lutimonas halocynthiae]MDN3642446.1 hypothetical protein [Lutimonas halocynthiae]